MYHKLSTFVIALALCGCAFAQYSGGMGPTMPSPNGSTPTANRSYGMNKAAIGGLVGGGAGAAILYVTKLRHPSIEGCVGRDGKTLIKDDGKRYAILGETLQPGERVVISAKKMKDDSGEPGIDVLHLRKDLGRCEKEAGVNPPAPPQ